MMYRGLGVALALLIAFSLLLIPGRAESQAVTTPTIVAVDLSRTAIYRGYQWIEVTAYAYAPPGTAISSLSGTANISAGTISSTPLAWITLTNPITKTVGNASYTINNLLVARVPVPFGAIAGRGELAIAITLVPRGGNATLYTYRYAITILDHTVIDRARIEAQVRLENARMIISLLEAAGVSDVSGLRTTLDNISTSFDKADIALYQDGDVDTAMRIYDSVSRDSTGLISQAIALFAARQDALERRLSSIESNLSTASTRISALERSVSSAADAIRSLASALGNYSNAVNTYLASLDKSVIDTNNKIGNISQTISSQINSMGSSINSRLDSLSSALSTVQLALVVVAIVMLIGFAIVGFVRRK